MTSRTGGAERDPQPERAEEQAGFGPPPDSPPPELVCAVRRPDEGASTLVLDAGGQNVIVVLGERVGGINQMWTFIRKYVPRQKATRM
jgi:hypothetical protein